MPQDSASDQLFPLGDEPIEKLAQDGLDWEHYVFALLRRLEAADTPFVLGVFGGWGSGKTSFLNMLGDAAQRPDWPPPGGGEAQAHRYEWRVIRVNPWECDTPEDAKRLLASSLWAGFFNESRWLTWEGARKRLRVVGRRQHKAAVAAIDAAAKTFELQGVGDGVEALFSRDASLAMQMRLYFEQDLASAVDPDHERILVLIDDLDRCQRKVIPEVLETIKLYLNQKGCVFVLAADPEAVADAIQDLYKPPEGQPRRITGQAYLEKIVQLPFYLPRLDEERTQSFFARCEGLLYEERKFSPDMRAVLLEHIFQGNPRAMKRFCMTHGLIAEIGPELEPDKLAVVLGLQMSFPAVFKACRDIRPSLLYRYQQDALAAEREAAPEAAPETEPPAGLVRELRMGLSADEAKAHARAALEPALQAFLAAAPKFENEDEAEQYFTYAAVARPQEPGAPQGLEAALEMLASDDLEERFQAARALAEIGDADAVDPLLTALGDEHVLVRWRAAWALGQIGDAAVQPLITVLGYDDARVRLLAVFALTEIGDAAVEPLITALRDDQWWVRVAAAQALGVIRRAAAPALPHLQELAEHDPDEDVRGAARHAVQQIEHALASESSSPSPAQQ